MKEIPKSEIETILEFQKFVVEIIGDKTTFTQEAIKQTFCCGLVSSRSTIIGKEATLMRKNLDNLTQKEAISLLKELRSKIIKCAAESKVLLDNTVLKNGVLYRKE